MSFHSSLFSFVREENSRTSCGNLHFRGGWEGEPLALWGSGVGPGREKKEPTAAASEAASSALGLCLRASRPRAGVATASRGFSRSSQPRPPRRPALRATLPRGRVPRAPGLVATSLVRRGSRPRPSWPGAARRSSRVPAVESRGLFALLRLTERPLCFLTSRWARSLAVSLPFPCFFSVHRGFLVARLCL